MTGTQVAFCANASFALPLSVALRSLSRFHREPVVVLHADFDDAARQQVERSTPESEIRWMTVPEPDRHRFPVTPYGQEAYYRLLLPRLLPDCDHILYIDADTLTAAPLDELMATDLKGRVIGAVRSLPAPYVSSTDALSTWQAAGLEPTLPYFNSGVLLIDAAQWRSRDLETATSETAHRLYDLDPNTIVDQDALNVQLAGEWTALDPRFNQHPFVYEDAGAHHHMLEPEEIARLREEPVIVHFIGRNKPWKATSNHPRTHDWRDLVSPEGFPDWQPESRSTAQKTVDRLRKAYRGLRGR